MSNIHATDWSILSSTQVILCIVSSTMTFTLLFLLSFYILLPKYIHTRFVHVKANPMTHLLFVERLCSFVNGIIIIVLCLCFDNPLITSFQDKHIYSLTTNAQRVISCIAIGYFIYDSLVCLTIYRIKIKRKPDYIYLFHHLIAIICAGTCIPAVYSGYICLFALFWSEISNPLLHVPKLLHIISRKQTLSIIIMKALYILLYTISKFVIIGYCSYQLMTKYSSVLIMYQIIAAGFTVLSLLLLPMTLKDFIKVYREYKDRNAYSYDDVEITEIDEYDTETYEVEYENQDLYNKVLSESTNNVKHYFVSGIMYTFFHCNRVAVYVLYAKSFEPTMWELSLILYGFSFWNGIASLIYGSVANQYGYDKVILILMILQFIGVAFESFATSFWMLFVGVMIAQVAITHLVIGYIAWILPLKYSTKYVSYFYTSFVIIYIVGPILAGFTSYYVSYRTVFIINNIVIALCFIYNMFTIRNTQRYLEQRQLNVALLQNKQENEQFPICLERYKNIDASRSDGDLNMKWYQMPILPMPHWLMLLSIMYIGTTVSIAENAIVLFYALYIIEDLHSNVIYGTIGIALIAVGFIIGNISIPVLFEKYNIKNIKIILSIIISCYAVSSFLLMFLYPNMKSVATYGVLDVMYGLSQGILSMASETLVLMIQPTKYSGKVSGAKGLCRNWGQAITALIIAVWWDNTHLSLFYVSSYCMLIGIFVAFIMIYTHKYWEKTYQ